MTKRRRPNKPKVWRAFTANHPLWNEVIAMRNTHSTWGAIMKYTAEQGYPLTQRQIEFGLQQAGIDYAHQVIPWIAEAASEFIETSLPALEYAQAALQSQATIITDMEGYCEHVWVEYERLSTPVEGMADIERIEARESAHEKWKTALSKRYSMMTQYLSNLILFRRALTDLLPADAVRAVEKTEEGMEATAAGVMSMEIGDPDVFWREARVLERTVRRDFEIILAAAQRGENVPELRPLGPGEEEDMERAASIDKEEEPDE